MSSLSLPPASHVLYLETCLLATLRTPGLARFTMLPGAMCSTMCQHLVACVYCRHVTWTQLFWFLSTAPRAFLGMSAPSALLCDAMLRHREDLKVREKELQVELRRRRKLEATRSKRAVAARLLQEDVAVHILACCAPDVQWLRSYCDQRGIAKDAVASFQEAVTKKLLDMGNDAMEELVEPRTPRGQQ